MGRGPWRQRKPLARPDIAVLDASPAASKAGCSVAPRETAMDMHTPVIFDAPERVAELERLGDQIAVLSAHLEAAGARLLDLIRDFDARGGWDIGVRSCADWLSWRGGPGPRGGPGTGGGGPAPGGTPPPRPRPPPRGGP